MNGRVDCLVTEEEINLTRGPSGLGFNIVGGTDQQYVSNDSGIYVSRIKENGAAALDGRLQEGDKILSKSNRNDPAEILIQSAAETLKYTESFRQSTSPGAEGDSAEDQDYIHIESSVNGQDLKNLLHQDAVNLFRNAGYAVSLRVQHRLQVQNGPLGHRGEGEPSGIPMPVVLVPLFALTMVAAWAFMRYRQQL